MSEISYRNLIKLSIPAILSVAMEPVAAMVDTAFVGRKDTLWLAGLAVSTSVLTAFTWVFNFLVYAVTARVAQAVGAGDRNRLGLQTRLALLTAAGLGCVVGTLLYMLKSPLLIDVMGAPEELSALAGPYYDVRCLGLPFVLLTTALLGILRGLQRIPFSLVLISALTLSNIITTWFALYVLNTGLIGAAVGTTGSFVLATMVGLGWLLKNNQISAILDKVKLEISEALSFGGEALDLLIRTGCLTGSYFIGASIATRLGTDIIAAHQIGLQVWVFASFFVDGIAVTATSLGGKFLGERRPDKWKALGNRLLRLGLLTGAAFSLLFFFAARPLQMLFTNDASLTPIIDEYWWLIVVSSPFNALVFVYDGILFGSRDYKFMRNSVAGALVLAFLPVLAIGYFTATLSITTIWLALVARNGFRLVTAVWFYWSREPEKLVPG
jgi:MATE family multidrug resistance protein